MLTAIDHSFGISWTDDWIARRQPSGSAAQAESLNFSGDGFRQILDELYPARIFVRGQFALYIILQLKAKLLTGFKLALQQHESLGLQEAFGIGIADDPRLENCGVFH